MKEHPDGNDTLRTEGIDAVRARSDKARPYINGGDHDSALDDAAETPLPYVDLTLDPIPPRRWLVPERIPALNVCLLSGEGAMGKSILLMQLSGAVTLGLDWLGTLPEQGPVIYLSAEEDQDEVRRRMEAVATHYRSSRADLVKNGLQVLSFAGKDAVLGRPGDRSVPEQTIHHLVARSGH